MHLCNWSWKSVCFLLSSDCFSLYLKCYWSSFYYPSYMKVRSYVSRQWAWQSDSCVPATTTEPLEEDVLVQLSIFKDELLMVKEVNYLCFWICLATVNYKQIFMYKKEFPLKYEIIAEYTVVLKLTWSLFPAVWMGWYVRNICNYITWIFALL